MQVTLETLRLLFVDTGSAKAHAVDVKESTYETLCSLHLVKGQYKRMADDTLDEGKICGKCVRSLKGRTLS